MARLFNNRYPYTDFHELNIGWCIEKITDFEARVTSVEEDVAALKVRATALETRMSAAENKLTISRQFSVAAQKHPFGGSGFPLGHQT